MNITVPINRRRLPIVFIVSFLLTIGAIINLTNYKADEHSNYWAFYIFLLLIPLSYCVISCIEYFKTIFDKDASLTISDSELIDNLSIFSCGKIIWADILDIQIKKAYSAEFLVIRLLENNKYLTGKNFLKRYVLRKWIKKWGSPIIISGKRVAYNLHDLRNLLLEHIK